MQNAVSPNPVAAMLETRLTESPAAGRAIAHHAGPRAGLVVKKIAGAPFQIVQQRFGRRGDLGERTIDEDARRVRILLRRLRLRLRLLPRFYLRRLRLILRKDRGPQRQRTGGSGSLQTALFAVMAIGANVQVSSSFLDAFSRMRLAAGDRRSGPLRRCHRIRRRSFSQFNGGSGKKAIPLPGRSGLAAESSRPGLHPAPPFSRIQYHRRAQTARALPCRTTGPRNPLGISITHIPQGGMLWHTKFHLFPTTTRLWNRTSTRDDAPAPRQTPSGLRHQSQRRPSRNTLTWASTRPKTCCAI